MFGGSNSKAATIRLLIIALRRIYHWLHSIWFGWLDSMESAELAWKSGAIRWELTHSEQNRVTNDQLSVRSNNELLLFKAQPFSRITTRKTTALICVWVRQALKGNLVRQTTETDWPTDRPTDWLTDWLVDWLTRWLTDWLWLCNYIYICIYMLHFITMNTHNDKPLIDISGMSVRQIIIPKSRFGLSRQGVSRWERSLLIRCKHAQIWIIIRVVVVYVSA